MISKSVSRDERNLQDYIILYRGLVSSNENNNLLKTLQDIRALLSFSKSIFSSPAVGKAFLYFCQRGASTAWLLQSELKMPEATVYRVLKKLKFLKIIHPAIKTSRIRYSKGGPRPVIWAIVNASTEEVSEAANLHRKMLSPKFKVAAEIAQTILDKFPSNLGQGDLEITFREIIVQVKHLGSPFRAPDIADIAAEYLNENGVKVWR